MAKKAVKKSNVARTTAPRLSALIACDGVAPDPSSKKITLYGVFDFVLLRKKPEAVNFWLYAKLYGGVGKHTLKIDVVGPDHRSLQSDGAIIVPVEIDIAKGANIAVVGLVNGLVFKRTGPHTVRLLIDGKDVGNHCELTVKMRPEAQA